LQARKVCLQKQCRIQERKLEEDFAHIRENSGSLFLSGLSWLIATAGSKVTLPSSSQKTDATQPSAHVSGLSGFLPSLKELWPVAWEIIRPYLISWGIRRMTEWFFRPVKRQSKRM
jgi:hypothetical protein